MNKKLWFQALLGSGGVSEIDLDNTVFLIFDIGQSNSIGRAECPRMIALTQYPQVPDDVLAFYKPGYTSADNGVWDIMTGGGRMCREPDQSGNGFGGYLILAEHLRRVSPNVIYIVDAGDGGTALKQNLTTPDWYEGSSGESFQTATEYYYTAAYSKIQTLEPGKTILPIILWHQGETDASDSNGTSGYSARWATFAPALRASHSSLADALLIITKLWFNTSFEANEATISAVFQAYADANPSLVKTIDISAYPRKFELTTEQKGGIGATYSDDFHTSYLGQIAKGEAAYAYVKAKYFPSVDDSYIESNTDFDPSTITTSGVRLQFAYGKMTFDATSRITAITNDLSIGTFNSFAGNPVPMAKMYGRKWRAVWLSGASARIRSSAAIGTSLFAGSFSFGVWIKPRDGRPSSTYTIVHDVQNTSSTNNSRMTVQIQTTGKVNAYIAVGGTLVQALTNDVIFSDSWQQKEIHIAVTYTNGGLIRIYIDGVLQTLDGTSNGDISALNLSNYVNNTNALTIGATYTGSFSGFFEGSMRELLIQSGVVWSAGDIANIMLN